MVPVFVVVILAVLLGAAIIAFIVNDRIAVTKGKQVASTLEDEQEEHKKTRSALRSRDDLLKNLTTLLPGVYKVIGEETYDYSNTYPYSQYRRTFNATLVAELLAAKKFKKRGKDLTKIMEKLEAFGK